MSNDYVLSGLIRKRAEISGEIEGARRFIATAASQLAIIDQALVIFGHDDPGSIEPIVKTPAYLFGRSELKKLVLDIYRECPELTAHKDIALEIIRRKEWNADAALVLSVAYRVKKARRRIRINKEKQ